MEYYRVGTKNRGKIHTSTKEHTWVVFIKRPGMAASDLRRKWWVRVKKTKV